MIGGVLPHTPPNIYSPEGDELRHRITAKMVLVFLRFPGRIRGTFSFCVLISQLDLYINLSLCLVVVFQEQSGGKGTELAKYLEVAEFLLSTQVFHRIKMLKRVVASAEKCFFIIKECI